MSGSEVGAIDSNCVSECFAVAGLPELLLVGERPVVPVQGDDVVPEPGRWASHVLGRRQHLRSVIIISQSYLLLFSRH